MKYKTLKKLMTGFTLSNKTITKIEPMTENIRKNFLSVAPITPKWSPVRI